jgi:hypothetical protein
MSAKRGKGKRRAPTKAKGGGIRGTRGAPKSRKASSGKKPSRTVHKGKVPLREVRRSARVETREFAETYHPRKVSKKDRETALAYRERRDIKQFQTEKTRREQRKQFQREGRARPARASRAFTNNDTRRLHRGYYFKDKSGRWRTPDGRRPAKAGTATRYNERLRVKLLKDDAYYSMLSYGADVNRRKFDRATADASTREEIAFAVAGNAEDWDFDEYYDAWYNDYEADGGDTP